ncbi:hypothetical protein O181_030280 [Austropuccinia psidii MF-1]|uniref:Uncharacterized protein n=1 Tax=Austropuccinia psidii MF-1 TaxID=1389203 RepID=A0A9Q3CWX5_9BASI|nr:hypothetical protein [Austropuccinia psidii MF-1]
MKSSNDHPSHQSTMKKNHCFTKCLIDQLKLRNSIKSNSPAAPNQSTLPIFIWESPLLGKRYKITFLARLELDGQEALGFRFDDIVSEISRQIAWGGNVGTIQSPSCFLDESQTFITQSFSKPSERCRRGWHVRIGKVNQILKALNSDEDSLLMKLSLRRLNSNTPIKNLIDLTQNSNNSNSTYHQSNQSNHLPKKSPFHNQINPLNTFHQETLIRSESKASKFAKLSSSPQKSSTIAVLSKNAKQLHTRLPLLDSQLDTSDLSSTTTAIQNSPSPTITIQDSSSTTTTIQDPPSTTTTIQDSSSSIIGIQDPPSTTTTIQDSSSPIIGTQDPPLTTTTIQDSPSTTATIQDSPSTTATIQDSPSPTAHIQKSSSPTTIIQESSSPITTIQEDKADSPILSSTLENNYIVSPLIPIASSSLNSDLPSTLTSDLTTTVSDSCQIQTATSETYNSSSSTLEPLNLVRTPGHTDHANSNDLVCFLFPPGRKRVRVRTVYICYDHLIKIPYFQQALESSNPNLSIDQASPSHFPSTKILKQNLMSLFTFAWRPILECLETHKQALSMRFPKFIGIIQNAISKLFPTIIKIGSGLIQLLCNTCLQAADLILTESFKCVDNMLPDTLSNKSDKQDDLKIHLGYKIKKLLKSSCVKWLEIRQWFKMISTQEVFYEDSDDELESLLEEEDNTLPPSNTLRATFTIHHLSYSTISALSDFLKHGVIKFAPLRSTFETQKALIEQLKSDNNLINEIKDKFPIDRRHYLQSRSLIISKEGLVNPLISLKACSPKNMYKLAHELEIEELKQLARKQILSNLTPFNLIKELNSIGQFNIPLADVYGQTLKSTLGIKD